MKYFAYGSNCNPEIMDKKGVEFTDRRRAALRGYELRFNKKSLRPRLPDGIGFANIEEAGDSVVEGILYTLNPEHLDALDRSERYPDHYTRIDVTVQTEEAEEAAFAYKARDDKTEDGLRPSRNYLNHILAARDFLSRQYFEALNVSHTYHGECGVCLRTSEVVFLDENERLYMLCQSCREARIVWGDVRGRLLTVPEAKAVMAELVIDHPGFRSVQDLVKAAIEAKIIDP